MKTIIFCRTSKSKDAQLSGILRRNLPNCYRVTMLGPVLTRSGSGEELLLFETDRLPHSDLENAVFLFGEGFLPGEPVPLAGAPLCIAASDNHLLLESIASGHPQVITCGMSPKDTFSCSGKSEQSAAISLLRETTNCTGKRLEPLELIFKFSQAYTVYNLLAYAAVLVLLGNISEPPREPIEIR